MITVPTIVQLGLFNSFMKGVKFFTALVMVSVYETYRCNNILPVLVSATYGREGFNPGIVGYDYYPGIVIPILGNNFFPHEAYRACSANTPQPFISIMIYLKKYAALEFIQKSTQCFLQIVFFSDCKQSEVCSCASILLSQDCNFPWIVRTNNPRIVRTILGLLKSSKDSANYAGIVTIQGQYLPDQFQQKKT